MKIVLILMMLLNLSTAYAVDLEEHDFDGNFKMDVPCGSSFEKTSLDLGLDINPTKVYQDFENDINISYRWTLNEQQLLNDILDTLREEPNVKLTQENDLYLITTEKYHIVLFDKDQKIFAVSAGNLDFNTLKEMANSVS